VGEAEGEEEDVSSCVRTGRTRDQERTNRKETTGPTELKTWERNKRAR
jgi:hypothetical protein